MTVLLARLPVASGAMVIALIPVVAVETITPAVQATRVIATVNLNARA